MPIMMPIILNTARNAIQQINDTLQIISELHHLVLRAQREIR